MWHVAYIGSCPQYFSLQYGRGIYRNPKFTSFQMMSPRQGEIGSTQMGGLWALQDARIVPLPLEHSWLAMETRLLALAKDSVPSTPTNRILAQSLDKQHAGDVSMAQVVGEPEKKKKNKNNGNNRWSTRKSQPHAENLYHLMLRLQASSTCALASWNPSLSEDGTPHKQAGFRPGSSHF